MIIKTGLRFLLALSLIVPLTFGFSPVSAQYQTARLFDGTNADVKGYLEYLPNDYSTTSGNKYPVMIFLHGLGEMGNGTTQIQSVTANGPPKIIAAGQWPASFTVGNTQYKFIVISPQTSIQWQADDITYIINQVIAIYGSRVDLSRIYITGLSLGGGGVEDYLAENTTNPNRIAAAVVCAGSSYWSNTTRVNNIVQSNVPIWFFHNEFDNVVNYMQSVQWSEHINAGGINPFSKLTIYPGVYAHDSWSWTYDVSSTNPNKIYEWMLGYTRPMGNIPPVSNAGIDQVINLPSSVNLDGTGSTAPAGSIVSYQWTHINGNWGDVIINPNSAKTSVTFKNPGDYIYELTVTDNNGSVNSSFVHIYVNSAGVQVPISNAGTTQKVTLPYGGFLSSNGSSAPSGYIKTYLWTKISGPAGDVIVNPSQPTTNVDFLLPGTYVYALILTDGQGNFAMSTVTVIVQSSGPSAPVSVPGPNQTLILPATASLDGSGSTDASGTISTYTWTKVSGPAGDLIISPSASKTSISFTNPGTYVYQLTVKDNGTGLSNSANITLTINSNLAPPISIPGSGQTITLPNLASLDGSGSTDPSGTISSYAWTKISGPAGDHILSPGSAKTNISFSNPGTYVYQLTVSDQGDGLSNSATISLLVNPAPIIPKPPIAIVGSNQTITLPAQAMVDGTASTDPSGTITAYSWSKISGPAGDQILTPGLSKTNISFTSSGTYVYQLLVTDNADGLSNSTSLSITVNPALIPPQANAGNGLTITLPQSVNLDGSASTSSGTLVSFLWVKLSGPSGDTLQSPNTSKTKVSFSTAGTYIYQLTVTDNNNLSSSASVTITVTNSILPPVSIAGANQTITLPSRASLDGSASNAPSGSITTYLWSKISGPVGDTLFNPNQVKTNIGFSLSGTYIYQLQVVDNNGNKSSSLITITVLSAIIPPPIANAGSNSSLTIPALGLLDGSQSMVSGSPVTYNWIKISGPTGDSIFQPGQVKTSVKFSQPGSYNYQITITDPYGNSSSASVTILVHSLTAGNIPPFANGGAYSWITLPTNTAKMNASASRDSLGTIVSYHWIKVSGPTGDSILHPDSVITTAQFTQAGTYFYHVLVTNNFGLSSLAGVQVVVYPAPVLLPTAKILGNQSISLPNAELLDGSTSLAPSGSIVSYQWTQISGPTGPVIGSANLSKTSISFANPGVYGFQLKVTDNLGNTATALIDITVNPAPLSPPIAYAGANTQITLPVNTVQLDASGSKDSSGTLVQFLWSKLSGPLGDSILTPNAMRTTVKFSLPGTYIYSVLVTDNHGLSSPSSVQIIVNPAIIISKPIPPVANPGINQSLTLPSLAQLNGSQSTAPSGYLISYLWTKLSGPSGDKIIGDSLVKTQVSFIQAGTYVYRLTVKDNLSQVADSSVTITVLDSVKTLVHPNIIIANLPTINSSRDTVVLNALQTNSTGGNIVKAIWTFISGPSSLNWINPDSLYAKSSNFVPGTYILKLTVTDQQGDTASKTLTIIVGPFPIQYNFISGLKLYPNPVQSQANLSYTDNFTGTVVFSTYNMNGQRVQAISLQKSRPDQNSLIDFSNLNPGIYILEVQSGNHTASIKFLKQ